MGQKILDIGPAGINPRKVLRQWEGYPLSFLFPLSAQFMLLIAVYNGSADNILSAVLTGFLALGNGLIGVIDDRTKFSKGKNEGLLSWQKYLLQLALCVVYLFFMKYFVS